jgi:sugar phosphate isomerase/epimerase
MLRLAAFADEISPDLDEQIQVCSRNAVFGIELRSVNKINVLDLDVPLRRTIRQKLSDAGMSVACIGSPIGKVKVTDPWPAHLERFKVAVEMAQFFGAPLIRLFSYYPPEKDGGFGPHRDEVIRRMAAKAQYVKDLPITLVHENEKGIFGEKGAACVDILGAVNSPKLRAAYDFANFVQAGEKPMDNWPALKPFVVHIHVKDALLGSGQVVPAGKGDGSLEPIIVDAYKSGYRGLLSLEPHLKVAGHSHGETGADLFKVAADALKAICARNSIPLGAR